MMPKMMIASCMSVVVTGRRMNSVGEVHGRLLPAAGGRLDRSRARRASGRSWPSVTTVSPACRPLAMTASVAFGPRDRDRARLDRLVGLDDVDELRPAGRLHRGGRHDDRVRVDRTAAASPRRTAPGHSRWSVFGERRLQPDRAGRRVDGVVDEGDRAGRRRVAAARRDGRRRADRRALPARSCRQQARRHRERSRTPA